jgi:hypothetical protein
MKSPKGKIQIIVNYTFVGSTRVLENLLENNDLESRIDIALSEISECMPGLIFDPESIRVINIPEIDNVEDYEA